VPYEIILYLMIRILLCSPLGGTVGGIQKWTTHILNYYNQNAKKVEIINYSLSRKVSSSSIANIYMRLLHGLIEYPSIVIDYRNLLIKNNYDIVHITSSGSLGLLKDFIMLLIGRKYGVKSIIHFHFGRIPELYQQRNWEQKLLHRVIQLADKIVVIDKMSFYTLKKEGYSNVELLPNPLTPRVAEIVKQNTSIIREERKLLFAGHVVRTKGVFELIEACRGINNIKLKIIGFDTNEIREELTVLAGNRNEEWLEIAGELDFESTIKEMLSAGVFLLPTYTEGFPNVVIESMACACPIVTTSVGAIPEMLDIENGFNNGIVIEPQNVAQLKDAIEKMLNDREYAIQCGINAQQRVNSLYSMPQVWKQMENIWTSVILKK
jgi:glycosyltransferase involved in cell wall biosynthesis